MCFTYYMESLQTYCNLSLFHSLWSVPCWYSYRCNNWSLKNHLSVTKIKEITGENATKRSFKFDSVTKHYITTLLKNIDIRKATGVDKIPPKLMKLSSNILSEPLTKTINDSLYMGIFPDAAKYAAVSLIDKGTENKNSISNFRPVSVLSVFSKIFEAVIKNQLALYLENIFSPFLSAYRENYSTQHVLIRLAEEWKKHLDNNEVGGGCFNGLLPKFQLHSPRFVNCKIICLGIWQDCSKIHLLIS